MVVGVAEHGSAVGVVCHARAPAEAARSFGLPDELHAFWILDAGTPVDQIQHQYDGQGQTQDAPSRGQASGQFPNHGRHGEP